MEILGITAYTKIRNVWTAAVENQKIENILNLSLAITEEEREKSPMLELGYDAQENTWEVIVKYSGSLVELKDMGVDVEEMRNEYAILTIPETKIDQVSQLPQIEYMEKPKRLFFAWNQVEATSFVFEEQNLQELLTGDGVLIGILDSGIDVNHPQFQKEDGSSRILFFWDQDTDKFYTKDNLEEVPRDFSGHGTAVAGIASAIAPNAALCIVKLGTTKPNSFPRTTELMRGINFLVNQAVAIGKPIAINISIGNTYGGHDGTSLLETFISDISNFGRVSIIVGSGNEGSSAGHTSGILKPFQEELIEFIIAPFETNVSIQLYKRYQDEFEVKLQAPDGTIIGSLAGTERMQKFLYGNTEILVYYGTPTPYSPAQEIFFEFIPSSDFIENGIWKIILLPQKIIVGEYDLWLPSSNVLNEFTRFTNPTPDTTLTIPSTCTKVITVGAYNAETGAYAPFSGRGFTRLVNAIKPDLVAPGVNIVAPKVGGGTALVTGTSFATPMVTASAALMMEWGIVQGNDPFLYGEKLKATLIRGAKPVQGMNDYPNRQVGWGKLDIFNENNEKNSRFLLRYEL